MKSRRSRRRQNAGVLGQKSNYELLDDDQKALFERMTPESRRMWMSLPPEEAKLIRPRKPLDIQLQWPAPRNEAERFNREFDERKAVIERQPRIPGQPRYFGFVFSLLGDKDPRHDENEEYKRVKAANPAYKDPFELNGVGWYDRNLDNPPAWFKRDPPRNEYDMEIDEGGRRMRRRKTLRRGSVRRMKRRV